MENQEIMVNEEVIEATEEIATAGSKTLKTIGKIGLGIAVVYGIYRGIKLVCDKVKEKKEQQCEYADCEDCSEDTED